jgi:hypothetical protein
LQVIIRYRIGIAQKVSQKIFPKNTQELSRNYPGITHLNWQANRENGKGVDQTRLFTFRSFTFKVDGLRVNGLGVNGLRVDIPKVYVQIRGQQ